MVSITAELLQNPKAFSSNTQAFSAAADEAIDDEVLLDVETAALLTEVEVLDFVVLVADEVATEEVAVPHKLPLTFGLLAVPVPCTPKVALALGASTEFQLNEVAEYGLEPEKFTFQALVILALASGQDTAQLLIVCEVSLVTLISAVKPAPQLFITV